MGLLADIVAAVESSIEEVAGDVETILDRTFDGPK